MTQKEIAGQLGVAQNTISVWEKERRTSNINIDIARREEGATDKRRKMPVADEEAIVARADVGEGHAAIAEDYGVHPSAIGLVVRRFKERRSREKLGRAEKRSGTRRHFTEAQEEEIEARYRTGHEATAGNRRR